MRLTFAGILLALAGMLLAADPGPKAGDPRFVGRWICEPNQFTKVTTAMLPDGRYFATITVAGVDQPQHGRYIVDGASLTFDVAGAAKPSQANTRSHCKTTS